jgi:hypothetical protein
MIENDEKDNRQVFGSYGRNYSIDGWPITPNGLIMSVLMAKINRF